MEQFPVCKSSPINKVREVTELLPLLADPHTEFVLLRSCFTLPKFAHLLRAVDTTNLVAHLQEFDRVTRDGLSRILGTALDQRAWDQAKLPVAMGGMGVRAAEDHAPAHYCASVLASQPLSDALLGTEGQVESQDSHEEEQHAPVLPPHLLAALATTMGEEEVVEAELQGVPQRQLGVRVDQEQRRRLLAGLGEDEVEVKARLQSLTLPHAGNWLNVAPITTLGLHLRPQEFVLAAGYRLGLPLYGEGPTPTCPVCHQPSDRRGTHSMSCGSGPERNWRHNSLRDAIHEYAVEAGFNPRKEVRFLLPGRDSRPADVLIPHFAGGRDAALDVTVVNPCQVATVVGAAETPGHAIIFAHNRKVRGAEEACQAQGLAFLPLVVESYGGWGEVARDVVRRLATALARQNGRSEDETLSFVWGRLATILQRANSRILAGRQPYHPMPTIDGDQ